MNKIPDLVSELVEKGQFWKRSMEPTFSDRVAHERHRLRNRRWTSLVNEARYDIYPELHQFVNWNIPATWAKTNFPRIDFHTFIIEIPEFVPIGVTYKNIIASEWHFYKYEMCIGNSIVSSDRYYEFPLFMAIACDIMKPKKRIVHIKEIGGKLEENAKVRSIKTLMTKQEELTARAYGDWACCG